MTNKVIYYVYDERTNEPEAAFTSYDAAVAYADDLYRLSNYHRFLNVETMNLYE